MRLICIAMVLTLVGCFPTSRFDSCEEGEQLAIVSGQEGCFPACAAGCASDSSCVDGICVSSELLKDPGPIITNNETNNNMMSVTGLTPEEAEEFCDRVADRYFRCSKDHCDLTPPQQAFVDQVEEAFLKGGPDRDSCPEAAQNSPGFVDALTPVLDQSCEETRFARCADLGLSSVCECTPPDTNGDTCSSDESCESGDFPSICIRQEENPSGYCTSFCPDSDPSQESDYLVPFEPACDGGHCSVFVDPGEMGEEIRGGSCVRDCNAQDDCDGESVCVIVAQDTDTGRYVRACTPFAVCNENSCPAGFGRCNADQICEVRCGTAASTTACETSGGTCMGADQQFCVLP